MLISQPNVAISLQRADPLNLGPLSRPELFTNATFAMWAACEKSELRRSSMSRWAWKPSRVLIMHDSFRTMGSRAPDVMPSKHEAENMPRGTESSVSKGDARINSSRCGLDMGVLSSKSWRVPD